MIEFKEVEIKYNDFTAVKSLNLQIGEGEFFTLLGPSGCGKTTTLRSLVGFINPSRGAIYVNGKDITHLPVEKRDISMVFQSYALFPTLNVYENIAFGLKVKKMPKEQIDAEVRAIAQKVDLKSEQLLKKVSELSGGQQQRVAIARALVLKPSMLVLDEPLSNLDASLRVQLRNELKSLQKKFGITTIYVTHDQEEALTLSDRIAVFNHGVVEQVGTPYEIYNQSATEFVCNFIGDINKLGRTLLEKVTAASGKTFDLSKVAYLRTERVHTLVPDRNSAGFAKMKASVTEAEYYGLYTKYTFEIDGASLKKVEIEDGRNHYVKGNQMDIYIHPDDILQY
ncbi:ABC transporter ATP-binding protein [Paenibacillus monticola]|uniref:ATP-binding cassette domain-containing protein n=1 Tax=Paenibacillus monticola TaxID=2666075 RepID=A0A7X2H2B7_9BACL|nr:ABC transporter ATP-binding protein [Paenibacillus monticola]MRN52292.1 ATP-binding cassette domain-containing protein [Paenibacillus monticola]